MSRRRIAIYAALSILPLIAALWIAGVDPNYLLGNDVSTTNGYVTGNMIVASAPVGGSVTKLLAQIGDPVSTGQTLAVLESPPEASVRGPLVPAVRLTGDGVVVHLSVVVGQNVTAGQPIATIADLHALWVVAVIDEGSSAPVQLGQSADVFIPALNQTFTGRVTQLVPDLGETSPRTAGTGTGTVGKAGTDVPIRIDFDYGDQLIYPGMSANVTIYVRG